MKTFYHLDVARIAFKPYLKPRALDWLIRGNFNTDFYGSLGWKILEYKVFPLYIPAKHWFKPIDHLDMCRNLAELIENWNELRRRMTEVIEDAKYPPRNVKKMLISLGRSSHSMTDVYAHSNYNELLYDYYKKDPRGAAEAGKSGLPLPEFVGKKGPLFSSFAAGGNGNYGVLRKEYLEPLIFTDECLPDVGPRSHDQINKDSPECKMASHPDYPDIFNQAMALAYRDVKGIVAEFFKQFKKQNPEKYRILTEAFPGEMNEPGPFEKRAIYWSNKFGAYK